MLNWTDEFSVGYAKLDGQHKLIFALIEELKRVIESGSSGTPLAKVLIGQIADYAIVHFETEEKILDDLGYPDLAEHKEAHKKYCEFVAEAIFNASRNELDCQKLHTFLKAWWSHHILEEDMMYRPFLETA